MIIKKYVAPTETEAILLAKQELGKDAIVTNIRTIKPKGIHRLIRKLKVEVTAAIDDTTSYPSNNDSVASFKKVIETKPKPELNIFKSKDIIYDDLSYSEDVGKETAIEKKLNNLQSLIEKQINTNEALVSREDAKMEIKPEDKLGKNSAYIDLIYNQLVENEVDEKYAGQLVQEIKNSTNKDTSVDKILANVYQKIVLQLGPSKTITLTPDSTKYVVFIGPTGVGKTTTIAKIASSMKLQQKLKIALITSDTYRIAAVEQLRTYANILGIPLTVVYSEHEMKECKNEFDNFDVVLIDTAGRSHKNRQQRDDIENFIATIPKEEREVYLVLSATTKYKDLVKIVETYTEWTDFNLIFTKLDETNCIGNIYNIRLLTGAPLSYMTCGQNVPDDISKIDSQKIAKQLLGGND